MASFLPTPPAQVAPGDCSYATCAKTRSLSLVSRLPGTSNGRYRGLEYTHEVWRSDFEVAQTSCATPREAWRHTLHGAGSGLLGKHRMSQTEEHLLEAPHSRAISET